MTSTPAAIPKHVAVIMDGNGRWAQKRGRPRLEGHAAGVKSVEAVVRACREAGVQYLTLYAFSTENWSRSRAEIGGLMRLLNKFLRSHTAEMHQHHIRLRVIGRLEDLPLLVRNSLRRVMQETAGYTAGQLILALSYGARAEIARAAREIARQAAAGAIRPAAVDEALVAANLYAPDVPDPDLLIRTSGELRVSNFLLWQMAYTEFYFTDVLWPDFREAEFKKALLEYSRRQRRFGGVQVAGAQPGGRP